MNDMVAGWSSASMPVATSRGLLTGGFRAVFRVRIGQCGRAGIEQRYACRLIFGSIRA
jgi:hypothetical protein